MRTDRLGDLDLPVGKQARLHRILYGHGLRNGTGIFLALEGDLERGRPGSDRGWSAPDPASAMRLAVYGGFNGVTVDLAVAERFYSQCAGQVPLVLTMDGQAEQAEQHADAYALVPDPVAVAAAVRLGADAIAYTLRIGSVGQSQELARLQIVRRDCDLYGIPLILAIARRSDPRVAVVHPRDGRNSIHTVDYFVRTAAGLGVDAVKVDYPDTSARTGVPFTYGRPVGPAEAVGAVVRSAGAMLVLVSIPDHATDAELLAYADEAVAGGATGIVLKSTFIWQREYDHALRLVADLRDQLYRRAATSA